MLAVQIPSANTATVLGLQQRLQQGPSLETGSLPIGTAEVSNNSSMRAKTAGETDYFERKLNTLMKAKKVQSLTRLGDTEAPQNQATSLFLNKRIWDFLSKFAASVGTINTLCLS